MNKKELFYNLIYSLLAILFIVFFVKFSNWHTKKALEYVDKTCQGRFDTSFECVNNGNCDCTKGKTNN